jgi:Reverse transcriptase (RNA-dependent DNA polymerase)
MAGEYIAAMRLEIQTLIGQHTWDTVDRPMHKSVLKGTWAFKLKRLPDGTPYRYKARFCARGDMQTEGVDFFETYAPVVQWSTIRLLLSTVLTEGWTTQQVDYTNAFAQAELHEEVYVECPRLFAPKSGLSKVLRLRKSLYGLRQAPRTFFEKLRSGLLERGWSQSLIDPCLFMKSGMMCVVYVDDTIFAAANLADIEREITSLGISTDAQTHTFALRNEGEVSAFLGIQIEKKKDNEFLLTQTGLIDKVLAVTKMSECNGCDSPATIDPLHADKDGEPFDEEWAYDGVIGMLMYLAGNTRPDIAYAVHQAARFTHGSRNSHAAGVKRILRYLQRTRKEGLYLKPGPDLRVDCHVDSDFGGLFSVEDKQKPISVKSRTGYVITYRDAPLMWVSKMQTQVALSTMEAEYIALSQSMRDLIPIREVLKEIMTQVFEVEPKITYHSHSKAFDDTIGTTPHVIPQSTVYEDNDACLKFARMPKLTPRTKHIGMPYHWFRTQVERLEIHIERVDTLNQLGDQFTKGLPPEPFKVARKRLMGW